MKYSRQQVTLEPMDYWKVSKISGWQKNSSFFQQSETDSK